MKKVKSSKLKNIKVLVWDFDGTLYKWIPKLREEVREAEYRTIKDHTGWSREKTVTEFNQVHQKVLSATTAVAKIAGIPVAQAAMEGEWYIDRSKYLKRDERLVRLFKQLDSYKHYLLVNGIQEVTRKSLLLLGLSPDIFEEVVTSETVGVNKPNLNGFKYIFAKTQLRPEQHLMIGDRESVDIIPARKLGFKTCLVWGESKFADVSLTTIYDLKKVLS